MRIKTGSHVRGFAVHMLVVFAAIVSVVVLQAAPAGAAASLTDADDTAGTFDIKDAAVTFDATQAVITIHMYESFDPLQGLVTVLIDVTHDGVIDALLNMGGGNSGLIGVFSPSPRARLVAVSHTGDTLIAVIPRSYLGGAGSMDIEVASVGPLNGSTVIDLAPDTRVMTRNPVLRIAGPDRIETAVQSCFQLDGGAGAVVLARSDGFADALAGGPLATFFSGCLLLTPTGALDQRTLAEIQRVLPSGRTVFLLGGEAALGQGVAGAVSNAGYNPVRLGGADRYETAVKIATDGLASPSTAFIATGTNFPDALGAGPAAAHKGGCVLLSNGSTLPPSTAAFLQAHPNETVFAIGGPAAAAVPSAPSVVGANRYETAVNIAKAFFPSLVAFIGVASGLNFPDALAGGAGIGNLSGPMLLSDPNALPVVVTNYVSSASPISAYVFGGTAAINESVVNQLKAIVPA